jgi:hypothetical protein
MADVKNLLLAVNPFLNSTGFTFNNHTVDANNDGIAMVFQARGAEAITHLGFRVGARTGTPPTYIIGLESVSATTGAPDGTILGGGSPASKTFTPPADATWDGTLQWLQLDNAYTPSRGQVLAITVRYSSGTIDASNFISMTSHVAGMGHSFMCFPNGQRLTAGTWSKQNSYPVFGVRTASTRYGNPVESFFSTASASTVGHRVALKFTLPAGTADTMKVKGAQFVGRLAAAAGKTPVFGLWDSSSVIQNFTIDNDWSQFPATAGVFYSFLFDEASLTALTLGGTFYLGLEVADAVNGGAILNGIQLDSASDLDAYPGGSDFHYATYDGATWSDDTTVRPFVDLILDDITEPAGGGGGIIGVIGE